MSAPSCPACARFRIQLAADHDEVRRLARLMARSDRNQERCAPQLAVAKARLEGTKSQRDAHLDACEAVSA